MIAELILDYGEPLDADYNATKFVLTRDSVRSIRRDGGKEIAEIAQRYRTRHAYVIAVSGTIITVAFANYSLLH
jgi:hypothetical protein